MTILVFLGVLSCAIKVQVSGVKREVRDSEDKAGVAKADIKEKRKVYVHSESWNSEIMAGDGVILTGCFLTGCYAIAIAMVIVVRGMAVKVKKERGEV